MIIYNYFAYILFGFFTIKAFPIYGSATTFNSTNPYIEFTEQPPRNIKVKLDDSVTFTCKFLLKNPNLLLSGHYKLNNDSCSWALAENSFDVISLSARGYRTLSDEIRLKVDVEDSKRDHSCQYMIPKVSSGMNQQFRCVVKLFDTGNFVNDNRRDPTISDITVEGDLFNLTILSEPESPNLYIAPNDGVIEGDTLNIKCISNYGNPAPQIEIYSNDKKIVDDQDNKLVYQPPLSMNKTSSLTITKNVTLKDDKSFLSCSVINDAIDRHLWSNSSRPLDVKFPPKLFLIPPTDTYSSRIGFPVRITCVTIAKPRAYDLRWSIHNSSTPLSAGQEIHKSLGRSPTEDELASEEFEAIKNSVLDLFHGSDRKMTTTNTLGNHEIGEWIKVLDVKLNGMRKTDSGKVLTCSASNGLSIGPRFNRREDIDITMQNTSVKINVIYDPVVSSKPIVKINEGDDLNLTCHIDANPEPFRINWRKQEREISLDYLSNNKTLYVPKVSRYFNGSYICRAENKLRITGGTTILGAGESVSEIHVLYAPGMPTISIAANNQNKRTEMGQIITIIEGKSFQLSCGIENASDIGNPKPSFKWSKSIFTDSGNIVNAHLNWAKSSNSDPYLNKVKEVQLAVAPTYKINGAGIQDTGIYYCAAYNGRGESEKTIVKVYVRALPKLVPERYHSDATNIMTVNVTQTFFKLECSFTGRPAPQIVWFRNGKPINRQGTQKEKNTFESSPNIFRYKLTHVSSLSSVGYNQHLNRYEEFDNDDDINKRFFINESTSAYFSQYLSKVTSFLHWKTPIAPTDKGVYTCVATNDGDLNAASLNDGHGLLFDTVLLFNVTTAETARNNFTLRVLHPPEIIKSFTPDKVACDVNSNRAGRFYSNSDDRLEDEIATVSLKCLVASDPRPEFNWRFDNHMLPKNNPTNMESKYNIYSNEIINRDRDMIYQSTLKINDLNAGDLGMYTCIINNVMGFSEHHISLQSKSKPDPPTDLRSDLITHESASILCSTGFDGGYLQKINLYYCKVSNLTYTSDYDAKDGEENSIEGGNKYLGADQNVNNDVYDRQTRDISKGRFEIIDDISKFGVDVDSLFARNGIKKISLQVTPLGYNLYNSSMNHVDMNHQKQTAYSNMVKFDLENLNSNTKYILWVDSENVLGTSQPAINSYMAIETGFRLYDKKEIPIPKSIVYQEYNGTITFLTSITDGLCAKITEHSQNYDVLFDCVGLPHASDKNQDTFVTLILKNIRNRHTNKNYVDDANIGNNIMDDTYNQSHYVKEGLYVKLCAVYDNINVCGKQEKAEIISDPKPSKYSPKNSLPQSSIVMIAISIPVLIILVLITAFIVFCLKKNKDKMLKEYEMKRSMQNNMKNNKNNINNDHFAYDNYNRTLQKMNSNALDTNKQYANGNLNYQNVHDDRKYSGFVNKGMDLVDEPYTHYNDLNFDQSTPKGNNTLKNHKNTQNYHQSDNNDTLARNDGNGYNVHDDNQSSNTNNGKKIFQQRFRTPEDLLLAASLEENEDDFDEYNPNFENPNLNLGGNNNSSHTNLGINNDYSRNGNSSIYDDNNLHSANISETSSQRIMHEVIV
ncbi:unnamed protein product [Gordionus sp. m RMFG-2023]|uniref:uncharacterized protein LOC135929614 n=1 Tax=Gordionus sp. m RMFG-2023 TaxID=3053472 RepID=UPI0030E059F6